MAHKSFVQGIVSYRIDPGLGLVNNLPYYTTEPNANH